MKKFLVLAAGLCMVNVGLAANYDLKTDWVWGTIANPNGAWSYGTRAENGGLGTGVFDPFIQHTSHDPQFSNGWDRWFGAAPDSTSCVFNSGGFTGWNNAANSIILNAWVNWSGAVHWAGDPGVYDLSVTFDTIGYAAPTADFPDIRVYITKNGGDFLHQDQLFGRPATSTYSSQVMIAPGDYLDFFIAGNPEARIQLDAKLTMVPEPTALALLGLGAALMLVRRQK